MKKIYVVGIGPGKAEYMTPQAKAALEKSEVIIGYNLYIDLLKDVVANQKTISTPMKKEVERCQIALEYALNGSTVAMVCSGDAGIYGMAGLVFEVCEKHPEVAIEVVAGITAASSSAAILGAPLVHDFAVISLSDLLTPWEKIQKRLRLAAEADFVICLYNPSSQKRADYLQKACAEMLFYKAPETKCGFVKNAGRNGESFAVCSLAELQHQKVDMFTTVIIGNSETKLINGRLVTPRGYKGMGQEESL